MFESYTEKALRTLYFARSEAGEFGSPCIGSEHLLLGLMREYKGLVRLFPKPEDALNIVRRHIEEHAAVRERIPISIDLPISDECQRILQQASEEAERMGHKHVGTEHLLLGILREQGSYVARLLNENGLYLDSVREKILRTDQTFRSGSQ
jgi:ATP-dependent Clp protease ATP-binding subunit ClpC